MGFNCLQTKESVRGDSLFLTTKSPGVSGTHLINSEGWKVESILEPLLAVSYCCSIKLEQTASSKRNLKIKLCFYVT